MAKDMYSVKVDGETKESLQNLTEGYLKKGLIHEKGDLLNIAANLLERNLAIVNPVMATGIDELDQLTARINRLFLHLFESNQTQLEDLKYHYEEDYNKSLEQISVLKSQKEDLEGLLTSKTEEINSLSETLLSYQDLDDQYKKSLEEKNKYIQLLESETNKNKEELERKDLKINELKELEITNQQLLSKQEDDKNTIGELQEKLSDAGKKLQELKRSHAEEIRNHKFEFEKVLFSREKELTEEFHKELDQLRAQRDEFFEKHEKKLSSMQSKYDGLLSAKQKLQDEYNLLELSTRKGTS